MSYGDIERLAREKHAEAADGYIVRKVSLDPVRLSRARQQVTADGERRAVGRHWWEKVDVHDLPQAPAGWPMDW